MCYTRSVVAGGAGIRIEVLMPCKKKGKKKK